MKKTFADRAYQTTEVNRVKTQEQIEKMLAEIGITDVRFTKTGNDFTVEFIARLSHNENARKVKMDLPFNTELDETSDHRDHRENVLFRKFYWYIKNKFIAVKGGLKEFEEAFLADLIIFADGKEQRLGDVIIPRYKEQLKSSRVAILSIK